MRSRSKNWPLSLLLLIFACPVLAELGGDVASVVADRVHMKAASRILAQQKYTVVEIQTDAGTVVREYVSPSGKVFAVAWDGPRMPDLEQLFGSYFASYQDAARTRRAGHGPLRVDQPGLVVHSGGHMRAFSGQAYVPQLLPQDVSVEEIK